MARTQSLKSIQKKIDALKAKAEELERTGKPGMKQLRAVLWKYKLGADDVKVALEATGGRGVGGRRGRTVEPKYRNPQNKAETWSGRGLMPRWMAALVRSGKKPEDFLIKVR